MYKTQNVSQDGGGTVGNPLPRAVRIRSTDTLDPPSNLIVWESVAVISNVSDNNNNC